MPSFQHRAIDRVLRLIRFRHLYWRQFNGIKTPKRTFPNAIAKRGRTVGQKEFKGFPFLWFDPKTGTGDGYVIALHGGGYVAEASAGHMDSYAKLADLTGKRIYAPYYPLAPFHSPAEIRDWTTAFIAHVREHRPDEPFLMTGDSAGANLALQLTELGVRPERLLLWSPWLDIEGANPAIIERDGSCALLRAEGLRDFAKLYHGESDPRDPLLSPIFRETEDLPPTLIISGEADLFHPDIVEYAETRAGQEQPITLHSEPGVWHDYMLFPTPEGRSALAVSADFLRAI